MSSNRLKNATTDYKLLIIKKPTGWRPKNHFETPDQGRVVARYRVASYAEAYDDLERCNRYSLHHSLDTWAIILAPHSDSKRSAHPPDEHA